MTDDLMAAFVEARVKEDEAWAANPECNEDPERVLREVQAKRAIISEYKAVIGALAGDSGDRALYATIRFAVAALAAIWSDHPDYRPEWTGAALGAH